MKVKISILIFLAALALGLAVFLWQKSYVSSDPNPFYKYTRPGSFDPANHKEVMVEYNTWLGRQTANMGLKLFVDTVNEDLRDEIVSFLNSGGTEMALASEGGYSKVAPALAQDMFEKQPTVTIFGFCMSACAEDLILGAGELRFFDAPLIGYHGNSLSMEHYRHTLGLVDPCPKPDAYGDFSRQVQSDAKAQNALYAITGHNPDFWKEQHKRLGPPAMAYQMKGNECTYYLKSEKADLWLPTSQQLRELLGLDFKGAVCADDPTCYETKLLIYFGPGRKFMVGDKLYVTAGE